MLHSQTSSYKMLMGRLTLIAALGGTKVDNAAFNLESLPTHVLGYEAQLQLANFSNLKEKPSNTGYLIEI